MANLKMVSPWIDYYHMVQAMFAEDKNVIVVFDEEDVTLKLYVKEQEKASALAMLLPDEKTFGNVTLKIEVYPGNLHIKLGCNGFKTEPDPADDGYIAKLFGIAFHNNSALQDTKVVDGFIGFNATYIVFDKKVVQYHNDSLADIDGKRSTLYQEIAKEIFVEFPGVFYCTSSEKSSNLPF